MSNRRLRTPVDALLAEMTDIFDGASIDDLLDGEFELDAEDGEEITVEDWIEQLQSLKDSHTRRIAKIAKRLRCRFEISEIMPTGYIAGICHTPDGGALPYG